MNWPKLTPKTIVIIGVSLYLSLSLAAIQGGILAIDSTAIGPMGPGTDAQSSSNPAPPDTSSGTSRVADANCTETASRIAQSSVASQVSPLGRAIGPANEGGPDENSNRINCAIAELATPPSWVAAFTNVTGRADPFQTPAGSTTPQTPQTPTGPPLAIEGQRDQSRAYLDTLSDRSRSRRTRIFDTARRALATRQQRLDDQQRTGRFDSEFPSQRTKLRGARAMLRTSEADGEPDGLAEAAILARTDSRTQALRMNATDADTPTEPGGVTLPDTARPGYDRPSAAVFAILEKHHVDPSAQESADVRALDDLPEPTRSALTGYLNAYLGYYTTTRAVYAGSERNRTRPGGEARGFAVDPTASELLQVRAAQVRLLDATVALRDTLEETDSTGNGGIAFDAAAHEPVKVAPVVSLAFATRDNTYQTDYALQVDLGGDDTYNNSAGGNTDEISAAALVDFGGSDLYTGRNGGAKGDGAGFLVDAGPGTDTYDASVNLGRNPVRHPCVSNTYGLEPGSYGTNGGGAVGGVGFLVEAGTGNTSYEAGHYGTNGGARGEVCTTLAGSETDRKLAMGFLLDAGGVDSYEAGAGGTNGGGMSGGYGSLLDLGGNDTYDAGKSGTNGGGIGTDINPLRGPTGQTIGQITEIDDPVRSNPPLPAAGGFLLDAGGSDTFIAAKNVNNISSGSNGGGVFGGRGFLLSAGSGDDTYRAGDWGTNGGGFGGVGFLLDVRGNETYNGGSIGTNGGGAQGAGFLLDGAGTDTYTAGSEGTNGGAVKSRLVLSYFDRNGRISRLYYSAEATSGFLLDAGTGADTYRAGDQATNGGALGRAPPDERDDISDDSNLQVDKVPAGFLLDTGGNDTYTAGFQFTNGAASNGIGLLYDNAGSDYYEDGRVRCRDCSRIPKGTIGAQIDRTGAGEPASDSGSNEVLVVDDNGNSASADCPTAQYNGIQAAVHNASAGATVRVCAGTYPGNVTVDTTGVTVRAAESGDVVLDGGFIRKVGVALLARDTTVTGFTARNFIRRGAAAFLAVTPGTTITNNTIHNSDYGILVTPPPYSGVPQTTIRDNTVTGTRVGIRVSRAEDVTIDGNTVTGRSVQRSIRQRGISVIDSSEVRLTDNTVTGFRAPEDRTYSGGGSIFGYGYGIEIVNSDEPENGGITLRENTMANNTYNLQLYASDPDAYSDYSVAASNTVNGDPVLYLSGAQNSVIDPATDPGYVACVDCVNVTIRNIDLSHNGQGVLVANSRNIRVSNVQAHDTWRGISVYDSPQHVSIRDNTIRESYNAIAVRHDCEGLLPCATAGASVLVANNTIRNTGFLVSTRTGQSYIGVGHWHGGAILVTGDGVSVRGNTVSNAFGAGISLKGGRPYSDHSGLLGTGISVPSGVTGTAAVTNNDITDAYIGVMSIGNEGTVFADNEIANAQVGIYNIGNRDLTYRDNVVRNATTGMFIFYRDLNITARNNSFRDVRWGLDIAMAWAANPPNAPVSHEFGTTNTVNGERILWLKGATERVIEDDDANMVVCVRCTNVTIRSMTLTDNTRGLVLWDSTNSLVEDVTVRDALHDGVRIDGGENNVVRDTTVIDSATGFQIGPINRRHGTDSLETVGAVRLVDNFATVENASFPETPYGHSIGLWTGPSAGLLPPHHTGISLLNPTTVTVAGNRMTNVTWGINLNTVVIGERNPREYQYPRAVENVQIVNNTVTHPDQPVGLTLGRRAPQTAHRISDSMGIWIGTKGVQLANAGIQIRNNTFRDEGSASWTNSQYGVLLTTGDTPSTAITANAILGYEQSLRVDTTADSNTVGVTVGLNRLSGASKASVFLSESTPGDSVAIHGNLLQPTDGPAEPGYGVFYANETRTVNATCNLWGATDGPSSPGNGTLTDPETGAAADGSGSAVSDSDAEGVANVRFDPWVKAPPFTGCAQGDGAIPTMTPTPEPTPTATETSSPTPTPPPGTATGNGSGRGKGNGTGTGGEGSSGNRGGEGKPVATAMAQTTQTPTSTVTPPTATPEIVPGFTVTFGFVAIVILVVAVAVRRRMD